MNILLTGANGFIGSFFLLTCKDRYNIERFSFLKDDFEKLSLKKIDTIVHLSALVHQMKGANEKAYESVNVTQTIKLAKKAKSEGVGHFIFMSTVKVYGEESLNSYDESSKCNPLDLYGKSKLKAEKKLQKLTCKEFKVSIIRTPIVYGYGVKANIKSLIRLVKKAPILPFGGIKNQRSFVYIGNLIALIEAIIKSRKGGVFLASDDEAISTTRLIELLAVGINKKIILVKIPLFEVLLKLVKPKLHQKLYGSLHVKNSWTKKELNFKNPYTIKEGINHMLNS